MLSWLQRQSFIEILLSWWCSNPRLCTVPGACGNTACWRAGLEILADHSLFMKWNRCCLLILGCEKNSAWVDCIERYRMPFSMLTSKARIWPIFQSNRCWACMLSLDGQVLTLNTARLLNKLFVLCNSFGG